MDNETKRMLVVLSILTVLAVVLFLLLSGYDLSGIEIHKGIRIKP